MNEVISNADPTARVRGIAPNCALIAYDCLYHQVIILPDKTARVWGMLDDDHLYDYPLLPKCGPPSELIGHLETPQVSAPDCT